MWFECGPDDPSMVLVPESSKVMITGNEEGRHAGVRPWKRRVSIIPAAHDHGGLAPDRG
jgi:hypothetical protein